MRRTPFRRNTAPKVKTVWDPALKAPPVKKKSKVEVWDATRRKMKVQFARIGVTRCEAGLEGCKRDNFLSFAHTKKRRNVSGNDIETCALLCIPCHNRLENNPEAVEEIIAKRETPVASIFARSEGEKEKESF